MSYACIYRLSWMSHLWERFMLVEMAGSKNIEAAGQTGFEAKMQVCYATDSCMFVASVFQTSSGFQ